MHESTLISIKRVLEKDNSNMDKMVEELNNYISRLEVGEQAELHGELSKHQLTSLYKVLNSIVISPSAKEHITWLYFRLKCEDNSLEFLNTELVNEMIVSYKQHKYLGIESLIIDAIKSEKINPQLLLPLEMEFTSKAFKKELATYKCRETVRKGGRLNKEQVVKLLEYRSYRSLEYALDCNAITKEGLLEFRKPVDNENDRKAKENLFNKAQNQPHI
ncbi:hypothetical protein KDC22_07335 [Paenibacillus tritici]|uniref:hypothetical protein n=1 Tax=Paenibacillus tritici TaxID=1873425 RepID=UPI001BACCC23|nr:hypothetical protein [Paenibacillus tritici]QUL56310.1 hypothetical protein KDC22_07335 [Paenibacillus tritici]